jgi:hypothetical protein
MPSGRVWESAAKKFPMYYSSFASQERGSFGPGWNREMIGLLCDLLVEAIPISKFGSYFVFM